MLYRKRWLALIWLAAVMGLGGCGGEIDCGEGTTEQDGACVRADSSESACGAGTTLDDGECVAVPDLCDGPTQMVDGNCVVDAAVCPSGAELDPNANECVVTDQLCGEHLALEVDDDGNEVCVSTDQVCDSGTTFEADLGLCVPDPSCRQGDIVRNGVCVDEGYELAENADLQESENNDPATGGAAESLQIEDVGEQFVFTGAVSEPSDLDDDGKVDQDRDVFSFTGTAGLWLQLSLQSLGLPSPGFVVEGPDGYTRYSPQLGASETARTIVLPHDGEYTVTVLPASALQEENEVGAIGGDDWEYVGALKQIDSPTPTQVSVASANHLSGSYDDLTDNYYELTDVQPNELLMLTVSESGADVRGIIHQLGEGWSVVASDEVGDFLQLIVRAPDSGSRYLLADWVEASGAERSYDVTASRVGRYEDATVSPDSDVTLTVEAQRHDVVVVSQETSGYQVPQARVVDSSGEVVHESASLDMVAEFPISEGGTYTVEISYNGQSEYDAVVEAYARPPVDLGVLDDSAETWAAPIDVTGEAPIYYAFELPSDRSVEVMHDESSIEQSSGEVVIRDDDSEPVAPGYDLFGPDGSRVASVSPPPADEPARVLADYFPSGGQFLLRVDPPQSPRRLSTYQFRLGAVAEAPMELGDLPADSSISTGVNFLEEERSMFVRFGLSAGQFVEVNSEEIVRDASIIATVFEASNGKAVTGGELLYNPARLLSAQPNEYVMKLTSKRVAADHEVVIEERPIDGDLGTVSAGSSESFTAGQVADDSELAVTFEMDAGSYALLEQDNDESREMGVEVFEPRTSSFSTRAYDGYLYPLSEGTDSIAASASTGGPLLAFLETSELTNFQFDVTAKSASALGAISADSQLTSSPLSVEMAEDGFVTFDAPAGQALAISQQNTNDYDVEARLLDSGGASLGVADLERESDSLLYYTDSDESFGLEGSTYYDLEGLEWTIETSTPTDLGQQAPGDHLQHSHTQTVAEGGVVAYQLSLSEPVVLAGEVARPAGENVSVNMYGDEFQREYSGGQIEHQPLAAGEYVLVIQAGEELSSHTLDLEVYGGMTLP